MNSIGLYITGYKGLKTLEKIVETNIIKFVVSYGAFYDELYTFCKNRNIPLYNSRKVINTLDADRIFFIGWQYLVEPRDNYIVLHDSELPRKYPGFCPTVTALINGDRYLGVTAFKPTNKVDNGPIYASRNKKINYPIKIKDALDIVSDLNSDIIFELTEIGNLRISNNQYSTFYAEHSIWRDEDDYFINWNKPAYKIVDFVNAVGYPYEGAKTWAPHLITIHEVEPVYISFSDPYNEHTGKIWSLENDEPVVVCGTSAIKIKEYEGTRITKLRTRLGCKL